MKATGDFRPTSADQARVKLLLSAPRGKWIALSADESRIVAVADDFAEVCAAAHRSGEDDPLVMLTPKRWLPRTY